MRTRRARRGIMVGTLVAIIGFMAFMVAILYFFYPTAFAVFTSPPSLDTGGSIVVVGAQLTVPAPYTPGTLQMTIKDTGSTAVDTIQVAVSNTQLVPKSISIAPGQSQAMAFTVPGLLQGAQYVITVTAAFSDGSTATVSTSVTAVQ